MKQYRAKILRWLSFLIAVSMLLSACAPSGTPEARSTLPPQIVETTKIVEVVATPIDYGKIVWLSTQLRPIQEHESMRGVILDNFPGTVEYTPDETPPFFERINSDASANKGTVDLIGGSHGDFTTLASTDILQDLTDVRATLEDRGIPESMWKLTQFGTDKTYYVPWMQATYIVAVNKKALPYLPAGADVNALTYDQYLEWAKNVKKDVGEAKFGFPAGVQGLLHRFFQGFLTPAYSGGVVTTFASEDAVAGWQWMVDIWPYVNPKSTAYSFMQEPLLSEDVWVAWDHVARLKTAFETKPDDFIAIPVPAGPKGRAVMSVIAGMGIPKTANNAAGAKALIAYITEPKTQVTTLREVGFFPVTNVDYPGYVSPGLRLEGEAVKMQANMKDVLPVLLPQGLGAKSGDFNQIYINAFTRIVIKKENIKKVLEDEKQALQAMLTAVNTPCWLPDPDSMGKPCEVK